MPSARRKNKKSPTKKKIRTISSKKVHPKVVKKIKKVKKESHELIRIHFSKTPSGTPEILNFICHGLPLLLKSLNEKKVGIEVEGLSTMDQSHDPKNPFHIEKRSQVVQLCLRHGLYKSHDQLMAIIPANELRQVLVDHDWIWKEYLTKVRFCAQKVEIKMIDDFFNVMLIEGSSASIQKTKKWLTEWCQSPVKFTPLSIDLNP